MVRGQCAYMPDWSSFDADIWAGVPHACGWQRGDQPGALRLPVQGCAGSPRRAIWRMMSLIDGHLLQAA
jgi:hypothetical protein